jgi:hypothetical protein
MGHIAQALRRPVLATLIFGLVNASNWCWDRAAGCTGHEVPMLMRVAIPFAAGVVSREVARSTALVMIIPAAMSVWPSGWRDVLFVLGPLLSRESRVSPDGQGFSQES